MAEPRRACRLRGYTGNAGLTQVFAMDNGADVTDDTDVASAGERFTSTSFIPNSLADA